MKHIIYRRKQSPRNRRKMISINERTADKECNTHVRKSFSYIAKRSYDEKKLACHPEIYIRKQFDTKLRQEKFSFKVKGFFYVTGDRKVYKIDFCHTLQIDITWKSKVFSPNKSETLT